MSSALMCSGPAKHCSMSRTMSPTAAISDMKKSARNPTQSSMSTLSAALAEQELRLLGIQLPSDSMLQSQSQLSPSAPTSNNATAPSAAACCFGRALSDQPSRDVPGFGQVPALLADCCGYLRTGGLLDTEGLFRVEGSRLRLRDLRQRLERGCGIRDNTPPQDVCSVLKAWLRELPEPLVPAAMAHALAEVATAGQASAERRVQVLRLCALLLTVDQLTALRFLCCFLAEVSRNSQRNRMDAPNLATSLGPSLLPVRLCVCPREVARLNSGLALLVEFPNELGRWPAGLHQQHLRPTAQPQRQPHQLTDADESVDDEAQQRRRRRRSSGALGGALKAVGRAVSRLASRSRSRSPGRSTRQPQQPPRASPSPPAVRRFLHRLSAGSSSVGPTRRAVCAVAPANFSQLPPLAPPRKQQQQQQQPPPPPPLPPLSSLPSVSALRTPLQPHQHQQRHHQAYLHRPASIDSPTQHCSTASGPMRAVHSIPTTPLRVLQSPLA